MVNFSSMAAFIWSVADLLRGDFKQSEYGRVILPFTLLRRLECVLEPTREAVIEECEKHKENPFMLEQLVPLVAKQSFFNSSKLTLSNLGANDTRQNLET